MSSTNFADAQKRLLERRALREAEARAHNTRWSQDSAHSSGGQGTRQKPLGGINRFSHYGTSIWHTVKGREDTTPSFRVGQVDAELLDEELLDLLRAQVGEGLKYFGVRDKPRGVPLYYRES
jgi:peroxin-2